MKKMKRALCILIITMSIILSAILCLLIFPKLKVCSATPVSKYRAAIGRYYDYMVIETTDRNEWLLSDASPKRNPYMKRKTVFYKGKKKTEFVPIFKNKEKVIVLFNTKGTRTKKDDIILTIISMKGVY